MRQMLLHAENHAILARLILANAPDDATCVRLAQKLKPNGYLVAYDKGLVGRAGYVSLDALARELRVAWKRGPVVVVARREWLAQTVLAAHQGKTGLVLHN